MIKKISVLLFTFIFAGSICFAQMFPPVTYEEEDGSPSTTPVKVKVSNGTLTNNGDGTVSLATGGGGSGDSITVNSTDIDTTANFKDNTDITWALTDGGAGGPDDITATVVDDSHNHIYSNIDPTTSANWASIVSDETGSGAWVFGTSPLITTPTLILQDGNGADPTTDGQIKYDRTTEVLEIGDGTGTKYTAQGDSSGKALSGDSATGFFSSGTIEHERGGLEADVSAYTGLIAISGGNTSEVDSKSELEAQISDVSDFAEADGDVYTGTHDFGGATSLEIPNATDVSGNTGEGVISWDSDDDKLYVGDGVNVVEIGAGGGGSSLWTDGGTTTYLTSVTDDVAIGGTDSTAPFFFDESAEDLTIGTGSSGSVDFGTNTIDDDAAGNLLVDWLNLDIQSAKVTGSFVTDGDATRGAAIDAGDGNWRLLFNETTDEAVVWGFRMPNTFDNGLVIKIQYSMASATSGTVEFEVGVMAISDGDSVDVGTASFDTLNVGSATVPATAGYLDEISISLTNDDSVAAGDFVYIYLSTDADDATNDTATGDREVVNVQLEWNRT